VFREDFEHFSVRIYYRGAQVVADTSIRIAPEYLAELFSDCRDVNQLACEKAPMIRVTLVGLGIIVQPRRRVVFRIEGDRHQMPVRRAVRLLKQRLLHVPKVIRHERAKSWVRAASENECNGERLATVLTQADRLAELVGKIIFR